MLTLSRHHAYNAIRASHIYNICDLRDYIYDKMAHIMRNLLRKVR